MEYKKRPTEYHRRSINSRSVDGFVQPVQIGPSGQELEISSSQPATDQKHFKSSVLTVRQKLRSLSRRQAYLLSASLMLFSIATPVLTVAMQRLSSARSAARYQLTVDSKKLVGEVNKELATKITHDPTKELYQYNKDAAKDKSAMANLGNSQQIGGGGNKYSVDLSQDSSKGISINDTDNNLSISLIPQFKTLEGKDVEGRIIYPLHNSSTQLIYSVKGNGLKEDLVVPKEQDDNLSFKYQLKLPNTLEARLQSDGSIGIYSADPTLFGNISYGSDADKQTVETARTKGQKTHLAFAIPAPLIKESGGKEQARAVFELKNDILTVKASNLKQASYPLSIDPSIVVTNASDFTKGNQEGNIEFDTTNNQIKRGALSGGSVGSWSSTSSFTTAREYFSSVVYNGYLYILGGLDSGNGSHNDVQYAKFGSSGALAADAGCGTAWCTTTSFSTGRYGLTSVAYNGYIYVMGGLDSGNGLHNDVQYAKINSDGSVGTWNTTSSFTTARWSHASIVNNGYMYILGGCTTLCTLGGETNDTQYVVIKADGTLGTWATTTAFTTARYTHAASVYNNFVYIMAGTAGFSAQNDVQYAPLKSDGTIGAWSTATTLPSIVSLTSSVATGGYLYVLGGYNGSPVTTAYYAAIRANGSLDPWSTTTALSTARMGHGSQFYNGYLYVLGGCSAFGVNCSTFLNDAQYAKIDPAGVTGNFASTTSFTTARYSHATVAYNGYIYVAGGYNGTYLSDVQYAPLNADGSVGTWATTTSFTTGRWGHTLEVYNGYMYIIGGCGSDLLGNCTSFQSDVQYAQINSNGTLGSWAATTNFNSGRDAHSSTINNGYLYIAGGNSGGALQNDVQYAPINTNGTIGTWNATTSFSTARYYQNTVASGNYLYIIAGCSAGGCGTYRSDVQYAPINTNGTVGAWNTTTSLPNAIYASQASVYKGYIYVSGGYDGSTYYAAIKYAPINTNGTVGTWNTTTSFTTARFAHTSVIYKDFLYVLGGTNGTLQNDVQYAQINNGGKGTVSSWTTNGTTFTTTRFYHGTVAYNGYIYVLGGYSGVFQSDVQYAPINPDGSIGTWATTTSMPSGRYGFGTFVYKGYLFITGGNDNNTSSTEVRSIPINANGTLGSSWATANAFTTARYAHNTTVYNGYVYISGGIDNTTLYGDVQYAALNSNGTVGTWASTTALPSARSWAATAAVNGYLYSVGGCVTFVAILGCTVPTNEVTVAPINSNGTIGSWVATAILPAAIYNHQAVIANGYIYVMGGVKAGGTIISDSVYAPITANGTVGFWDFTTNLSTGRFGHASIFYNGRVYTLGGCSVSGAGCSTYLNDTIYSGQEAIPRVGKYSYATDYGGDANLTKMYYRGTVPNGSRLVVNYTSAPSSTAVFGSATNINELSSNSLYTFPKTETKNYWFNFALDDSQSAIFPDIVGTPVTLTDFEVFFHAATGKRLRGGKTFTSEIQRSLDTQP